MAELESSSKGHDDGSVSITFRKLITKGKSFKATKTQHMSGPHPLPFPFLNRTTTTTSYSFPLLLLHPPLCVPLYR